MIFSHISLVKIHHKCDVSKVAKYFKGKFTDKVV